MNWTKVVLDMGNEGEEEILTDLGFWLRCWGSW